MATAVDHPARRQDRRGRRASSTCPPARARSPCGDCGKRVRSTRASTPTASLKSATRNRRLRERDRAAARREDRGRRATTASGESVTDAVVWRLKADGGPEPSTARAIRRSTADGQADLDNGGEENAKAVAVQPDGKIVLVGSSERAGHHRRAGVAAEGQRRRKHLDERCARPQLRHRRRRRRSMAGGTAQAAAVAVAAGRQDPRRRDEQGPVRARVPQYVWRLAARTAAVAQSTARSTRRSARAAPLPSRRGPAQARARWRCGPDRRIVVAGCHVRREPARVPGARRSVHGERRQGRDRFRIRGSHRRRASPAGARAAGPFDDGTAVTLTATPAAGSGFAGWSGAAWAVRAVCSVTMSGRPKR